MLLTTEYYAGIICFRALEIVFIVQKIGVSWTPWIGQIFLKMNTRGKSIHK